MERSNNRVRSDRGGALRQTRSRRTVRISRSALSALLATDVTVTEPEQGVGEFLTSAQAGPAPTLLSKLPIASERTTSLLCVSGANFSSILSRVGHWHRVRPAPATGNIPGGPGSASKVNALTEVSYPGMAFPAAVGFASGGLPRLLKPCE